jgi:hypothetical protein
MYPNGKTLLGIGVQHQTVVFRTVQDTIATSLGVAIGLTVVVVATLPIAAVNHNQNLPSTVGRYIDGLVVDRAVFRVGAGCREQSMDTLRNPRASRGRGVRRRGEWMERI